MFQALYFCNEHDGKVCCDYIVEGVYFTFTFSNGQCTEHNEAPNHHAYPRSEGQA